MSKLLEQINSELETKETVPLANLMSQITSKVNKIQKSDYLKFGLVPIYDQGDNDVSGYSNDVSNAYNRKLPVVIFGDHTLRLKRISSPFFLGADGNQLIEPLDENILDRNYFYYLLLSKKPRSYGYERHFKYLKEVEVKVPNLPTQKKIAEILSAYDAKIENNNLIIKKLEATAQTIFNEWFVNFKFPGHEKVKMVDSEMGEIPEGWEVGKISDLGNVVCGKTPSKSHAEYFGGNILFIKIPDMHDQVFINTTEDSLTEAGENVQKNKTVPAGSICVSCIATVGLVSITTQDSQTNQQINTLVPNSEEFLEYLYFTLVGMKSDLQAIGSGGSTTLNVNTSVFSGLETLIPNKEVVKEFHRVVSKMFDGIKQLTIENVSLRLQRDQLLAKLI